MLDRVIESWRTQRFAAILAVEHARTHELPRGARSRAFDDTIVTIYRL
jgi:16S rRNA (guanine966-N2)-methyltransferase